METSWRRCRSSRHPVPTRRRRTPPEHEEHQVRSDEQREEHGAEELPWMVRRDAGRGCLGGGRERHAERVLADRMCLRSSRGRLERARGHCRLAEGEAERFHNRCDAWMRGRLHADDRSAGQDPEVGEPEAGRPSHLRHGSHGLHDSSRRLRLRMRYRPHRLNGVRGRRREERRRRFRRRGRHDVNCGRCRRRCRRDGDDTPRGSHCLAHRLYDGLHRRSYRFDDGDRARRRSSVLRRRGACGSRTRRRRKRRSRRRSRNRGR